MITTTPANPSSMPSQRRGVSLYSVRVANANRTVHKGVVALMAPARLESTCRSAKPKGVYGIALAKSAAMIRWSQVLPCREAVAG
jgi:hypothetical protein